MLLLIQKINASLLYNIKVTINADRFQVENLTYATAVGGARNLLHDINRMKGIPLGCGICLRHRLLLDSPGPGIIPHGLAGHG